MRTKRIKLYKYSELNIKAQQRAVNDLTLSRDKWTFEELTPRLKENLNKSEFLKDGTIYTEQ